MANIISIHLPDMYNKMALYQAQQLFFYDRALASVRSAERPRRVGVCFSAFFDDHTIPIAEHDVPMQAVVTEYGVVECSPGARLRP